MLVLVMRVGQQILYCSALPCMTCDACGLRYVHGCHVGPLLLLSLLTPAVLLNNSYLSLVNADVIDDKRIPYTLGLIPAVLWSYFVITNYLFIQLSLCFILVVSFCLASGCEDNLIRIGNWLSYYI